MVGWYRCCCKSHAMTLSAIASFLGCSVAWVSLRHGLLEQMSLTVRRLILAGKLPLRCWLYAMRPFTRVKGVDQTVVDSTKPPSPCCPWPCKEPRRMLSFAPRRARKPRSLVGEARRPGYCAVSRFLLPRNPHFPPKSACHQLAGSQPELATMDRRHHFDRRYEMKPQESSWRASFGHGAHRHVGPPQGVLEAEDGTCCVGRRGVRPWISSRERFHRKICWALLHCPVSLSPAPGRFPRVAFICDNRHTMLLSSQYCTLPRLRVFAA